MPNVSPEVAKKVEEVEARRRGGMSTDTALKEVGISHSSFYTAKRRMKARARKAKPAKLAREVQKVPVSAAPVVMQYDDNEPLVIIRGKPDDVNHALALLAKLGR